MARDINDIHDFFNFLCDKEMVGYFSPEEKDKALTAATNWHFVDCLKRYAVDQEAQDELAPFKDKYEFTNGTSPLGVITFPAEYAHFLGGWTQQFDNELGKIIYEKIELVNDDELPERLNSQLNPVSAIKPIGQWVGKGKIQLYPKVPNAGYLSYLKSPATPKFAYTMGSDDREVNYDASGSTQLEWGEISLNKVIFKAVTYLGLNVDEDKLVQYGIQVEKQA